MAPTPGRAALVVLAALRSYKVLISPLFTGSCRFHPSCSDYMADAIRAHGAVRGVWLGLRRLARCHPFGGSGYDPVPSAHARAVWREPLWFARRAIKARPTDSSN